MAEITLTSAWTQVGSGPMCVQPLIGRVYVHFSASAPSADALGLIPQKIQSLYPEIGAAVWARSQTIEPAEMVWMPCAPRRSGSGDPGSGGGVMDFSDAANSGLLAAIAA